MYKKIIHILLIVSINISSVPVIPAAAPAIGTSLNSVLKVNQRESLIKTAGEFLGMNTRVLSRVGQSLSKDDISHRSPLSVLTRGERMPMLEGKYQEKHISPLLLGVSEANIGSEYIRELTPGSTVAVSITETGFDPETITVAVGTTVVWTNHTAVTQQIVADVQNEIYLPLVMKEVVGGVQVNSDGEMRSGSDLKSQHSSSDWSSGPLGPGESYSYTFAAVGDYPYFLDAYPGQRGTVIVLAELMPDFEIDISPGTQSILLGGLVTYTVSLTAIQGFNEPVTLSVSDLPAGVSAVWSQNPVIPDAMVFLNLWVDSGTEVGDYTLKVNGSGGGEDHQAQAGLVVQTNEPIDVCGTISSDTTWYRGGIYRTTCGVLSDNMWC
jgi:plastocyanin